jgi:fermentation-respiration switch protein FrsA (DUF1100 family)
MWTALAILLAIEVILPLLLWGARDRLLFHPDRSLPAEAGMPWIGKGVEAEVVRIGRLEAYDARPTGAPDAGPVVLYLHGNGGHIAGRAGLLGQFVRGTKARVLMPGYGGYGGSEGTPTEASVVADALAAYDHLRASGVPASRIVLYGESIGGAVAGAVAEKREVAGVVFQSSFSSVSSMALSIYPLLPLTSLLTWNSFPTADRVATLKCPMLVVHGDRDEIVPYSEGKRLHRAAAPRADFHSIPGAHHNDLVDVAGEVYLEGLGERFRKWAAPR